MGVGCSSVQTRNKRTNAHARRECEKGKSMGGKREYSSTGVRREITDNRRCSEQRTEKRRTDEAGECCKYGREM